MAIKIDEIAAIIDIAMKIDKIAINMDEIIRSIGEINMIELLLAAANGPLKMKGLHKPLNTLYLNP